MPYALDVTLINKDRNTRFYHQIEPLDSEPAPSRGDIYRNARAEYGRCTGRVYIEGPDGMPVHVGWTFESRQEYTDNRASTYIREAWISIVSVSPPPRPRAVPLSELPK